MPRECPLCGGSGHVRVAPVIDGRAEWGPADQRAYDLAALQTAMRVLSRRGDTSGASRVAESISRIYKLTEVK